MQPSRKQKPASKWPIIVTLGLILLFTAGFVLYFLQASQDNDGQSRAAAADYREIVDRLLVSADAEAGQRLVERTYECYVCHIQSGGQTAPGFEGIADRAAERRPPLTAAAYLYESIVHPGLYVVEGYANSMPANYEGRLSDEELGDILAYLLEQTAP